VFCSDKKEKVWGLAAEIIANDDAALRNVVGKVKKGNDLLEKLVLNFNKLTLQEKVEMVHNLSLTNQSLRTQTSSVRNALAEQAGPSKDRRHTVRFFSFSLLSSDFLLYRIFQEMISTNF
jgi:hypothetical protein